MGDWMPRSEQGQLDLMERWTEVLPVAAKQTAYGWPAGDCADVVQGITDYRTARDNYIEDDSSEKLRIKNERKHEAVRLVREFAAGFVRSNKRVPPEEKEYLGLTPKDTVKSEVQTPDTAPLFSMSNHGLRIIRFEIRKIGTARLAIPKGYIGAICYFAVGEDSKSRGSIILSWLRIVSGKTLRAS